MRATGSGVRLPATTSSPLRIDKELAEEARGAGCGAPAEAHTRRRAFVQVSEHHLHHVDGGTELVGNAVLVPVDTRAGRVPRRENGSDCAGELNAWVTREPFAGLLPVGLLKDRREPLEVVRPQLQIEFDAVFGLERRNRGLEDGGVDAGDDLAVHLNQPAVGVVGEAAIPSLLGDRRNELVVETEVQDRFHHSGHRDGAAGPNREQQRTRWVSEALPGPLLEPRQVTVDLRSQAGGLGSVRHRRSAGRRRDREALGHRQAEL